MKPVRNLNLYKRMKNGKSHEFDDKYKDYLFVSNSLKDTYLKQKTTYLRLF